MVRIPKHRNGYNETRSREAHSLKYTGYLFQSLLGTRFQQDCEVEAADGGPTWVERRVVDEVFTTMTPRCSNKKKRQTSSSISLGNSRRVFIVVQKQPRRLRDQVPPSPGHPVQLLVNFKRCCNAGAPLENPLLRPMWIFLCTGGLFGGTGRIQPINSSASHQRRL